MRILITGGAGFLGSHLSEYFVDRGDDVTTVDKISKEQEWKIAHLIDKPNFRFFRGSVLNENLMDKLVWESDVIYHFAAVVGVEHYVANPYDVLNVNVNGTRIVLDLAFQYNKKVIFASTSEVYGRNTDIPFSEDSLRVLGPTQIDRWCYSTSKATGEHFCFAYMQKGLEVVILRFFNAYGPRLDSIESGRVISIFLGQLLKGKPVTVIGDGSQTRCFTYITDIIDGIVRSEGTPEGTGEVFNLGTDVETSIQELAEVMLEIWGETKSKIESIKSEGKYGLSYEDISRRVPDVSKAKRLLGFNPKVELKDGLKATIDWVKSKYCENEK
jgi:UDP-glucose 4-epimerase